MFSFSHKTFTNFSTTPNSLRDSFSDIKQHFNTTTLDKQYIESTNSYKSPFEEKEETNNHTSTSKTQNKTNSSDSDTKSNNDDSQNEIDSPPNVKVTLSGAKEVQESNEALYTVSIDMTLDEDLILNVETSHSTTQDDDYVALYQTVTIKAGETSVDFTVQTLDDTINEDKEDYIVTMSIEAYNGDYKVVVDNDTVTTTIIDEVDADVGATLSLSGDTSTQEGEDASYTLFLDNKALQSMDIQVKVSNITTDGDIKEEIINLTIEKDQTEVSFNISNVDDDIYEETQQYRVQIISNTDAGYETTALGNCEVITSILDNDTQNNAPVANDDSTSCISCSSELASDNFDENDGWGCNVFNGNLVLWAMDNSASKTFDFGIQNAGKTVLISIDAKSGGLVNPIHSDDDTFSINGTEFSLSAGEEAKLFSVEVIVDADGNVEVEFARSFCDGITQDVILDNLSITALGSDWECNQIVLVNGFKDDNCPLPINHMMPNMLDNDVTLSMLNPSESNSFDLGLENAGKTLSVSFTAQGLSAAGLLNLSDEVFYINDNEMTITEDCEAQTFTLDLEVDKEGKVDIEFSRPKSSFDAHLGGSLDLGNLEGSLEAGVDADLNHLCELIIINDFKILGSLDEWGCSAITTDENTPVLVAVLNNDNDPDNDAISITHIQGQDATNGEIIEIINAGIVVGSARIIDEEIEFTPGEELKDLNDEETQEVVFEYTITDEYGATDSADVTIEVTGISDESSSELPASCLDLSISELCLDLSSCVTELTQTMVQDVQITKEEISLSLSNIFDVVQESATETQDIFESTCNDFSDFSIGNIELIVDENTQNNWF